MCENDNIQMDLYAITTIIKSKYIIKENLYVSQASGFYYNEIVPINETGDIHGDAKIEKTWLVTNRHVILHKDENSNTEYLPNIFTFCLREHKGNRVEWKEISLFKQDLINVLRLHKNKNIDVAIVDVSKYIDEMRTDANSSNIFFPRMLSNRNLPENQPIDIEVTSDIVIASYPKNFYDDFNKFPIIKSGIIASGWNLHFNGEPIFQIDAQLFPGSSGGLVISKPTNITVNNGQALYHKGSKQFVLLGVYSGEFQWDDNIDIGSYTIKQKRSYGLGNVWYSYLITEIINNGIKYNKS